MKKLKGAKVLETSVQKTVQGGLRPGPRCNYNPDDCPSGKCCDVRTRRCVFEATGFCA